MTTVHPTVFTQWSVGEDLGCFPSLVTMISAAAHTGVQKPPQTNLFLLGYDPREATAGPAMDLFLPF